MRPPFATAPSAADIEAIARAALEEIPDELRRLARDVPILVEEFPDEATQEAMNLETPFDILGLYQGVALDQKSVIDVATDIDRIFLYRRPLLDYWCETGETLEAIVRNTLIHEIGHHFGFSDEDMERLEAEP
ncbi:MAG: metallopeptidase family protein [Alphaproteobacteria bacterium]